MKEPNQVFAVSDLISREYHVLGACFSPYRALSSLYGVVSINSIKWKLDEPQFERKEKPVSLVQMYCRMEQRINIF